MSSAFLLVCMDPKHRTVQTHNLKHWNRLHSVEEFFDFSRLLKGFRNRDILN